MESLGKFCTNCNRKTRHQRQGEGSICALCGTYSSPSQEEVAARSQRRTSEDALRTIESSRRVRETLDQENSEKEFKGKIAMVATATCMLLMIIIVSFAAWILLR